ncbi:hypothetical protein chiPu_0011145 [Chiloscyllium punctatum]|uniref:A kinase-anchoring proteins AKAP-5 and AKAP-12 calmodulin (CaM)-binding domain-containing protein n=1 Tax=Chiloscyllium punctatum TaxID=137246 RepID=A0A401SQK1_CHIPU|nr:hypothetical protein [Chiloscyllium punctatum]
MRRVSVSGGSDGEAERFNEQSAGAVPTGRARDLPCFVCLNDTPKIREMGSGISAQEPDQLSPSEQQEEHHTERVDGGPAQENGQISGIHSKSEDKEPLDGKVGHLSGVQEEAVHKVEPPVKTQEEKLIEMDFEKKETPTQTKDEEPRDSQEDADPPVEIGEEAQAGEVGFKKVFKFVGCTFTVKKENPDKLEPVQLLTVKKDEASEIDGESKQEMGGMTNGDLSLAAHEAEESPPEVLTPGEMEESTSQAAPNPTVAEKPVKSAVSPVENPAVDSPLKRFFWQGFFSVLQRKPSFKKAEDEPLVIGEKPEVNGEQKENEEQVVAAGDVNGEEGDHGPSKGPSASQDDAEILEVRPVKEKERDDDFEDLSAELAKVREAEGLILDSREKIGEDSVSTEDGGQCGPKMKMTAPALEMDQATQLTVQSQLAQRQVKPESAAIEDLAGLQTEQTDVDVDQTPGKVQEPVVGEAELLSSQEKAKLQGSPLKKLFTSSSTKKHSGKKRKRGKRKAQLRNDDETRLQSSTESEGSPDGQKMDIPPLTSPEEAGDAVSAEMPDASNPEVETINEASDGERKKENITAWASFKKLVTSKKRPKVQSESDREDEQTDKAKGAAVSSSESVSAAPADKPEKPNAEDLSLERNTEDPKKKADAPVTWEALICVGSSKKRTRKSNSKALQPDAEAQKSPEGAIQVPDSAEELNASVPQDIDQEQGTASPEGTVSSPVEADVSDSAVSVWESFKRLVTSSRKSKFKSEDRADDSVVAAEAAVPETEQAKEESWMSLRKLIPGRRKKRSDARADQPVVEDVGKETTEAELGVSKGEEPDTPAVVPLSEYDAVEEERAAKEQQETVRTNALPEGEVITKSEAPAEGGEPRVEQAITVNQGAVEAIKSSVDERSPSWISTAVPDVIEKRVEGEGKVVEEIVTEGEQLERGDAASPAEVTKTICHDETASEAEEITCEVAVAPDYLTEETAKMVSAVLQTSEILVTTAECTFVPEDEVLVTRQTDESLQEAVVEVTEAVRKETLVATHPVVDETVVAQEEALVATHPVVDETVVAQEEALVAAHPVVEETVVAQEETLVAAHPVVDETVVAHGETLVATHPVVAETVVAQEETLVAAHSVDETEAAHEEALVAAHPVVDEIEAAREETLVATHPVVDETVVAQEETLVAAHPVVDETVVAQEETLVAAHPVVDETVVAHEETLVAAHPVVDEIEAAHEETLVAAHPGVDETEAAHETLAARPGVDETEASHAETMVAAHPVVDKIEAACEETLAAHPVVDETGVAARPVVEEMRAAHKETAAHPVMDETGAARLVLDETGVAREDIVVAACLVVDETGAACKETAVAARPVVDETGAACKETAVAARPVVDEMGAARKVTLVAACPVLDETRVAHEETVVVACPVVAEIGVASEEFVVAAGPGAEETEAARKETVVAACPVDETGVVHEDSVVAACPVVDETEAAHEETVVVARPVVDEMGVAREVTLVATCPVLDETGVACEVTLASNPVVEVTAACEETLVTARPDMDETGVVCEDMVAAHPVVPEIGTARGETVVAAYPVVDETGAAHEETVVAARLVLDETAAVCEDNVVAARPAVDETGVAREGTVVATRPVMDETGAARLVLDETGVAREDIVVAACLVVDETGAACKETAVAARPVVDETGVACEVTLVASHAVVEVMGAACEETLVATCPVMDEMGVPSAVQWRGMYLTALSPCRNHLRALQTDTREIECEDTMLL